MPKKPYDWANRESSKDGLKTAWANLDAWANEASPEEKPARSEAIEKIKAAQNSQFLPTLSLHGLGLSSLPVGFEQLIAGMSGAVDLSQNRLGTIPAALLRSNSEGGLMIFGINAKDNPISPEEARRLEKIAKEYRGLTLELSDSTPAPAPAPAPATAPATAPCPASRVANLCCVSRGK